MLIVFCFMLFGCSLVTLILPDKEFSVTENRELEQKPKFKKKKFLKGKYQTQYENYLNDQFFFRDKWVDVAVGLQQITGKKDINGVYLGKAGYLLEKNGEEDFDADQVQENLDHLSAFLNDMTEMYGEDHVSCLMIPSKALALENRLPAFAEEDSQKGVLDSLRKSLSHSDVLFDLCDILQQHQEEYIYYRTDHHWTTLGAYYSYQAWAEKTGQAAAHPLEHYQRETAFGDFYGTTYNKVHVRVPADSVELFHAPGEEGIQVNDGENESDSLYFYTEALQGFNRYNVFLSKNTFRMEINTKAGTGRILLLIKDSFANCFVPFLTEDYDRVIMIDYRYGKTPMGKILEDNEDITDVLVLFNTEKFMQNTKLDKLADTRKESQTMEEFNLEDFLE